MKKGISLIALIITIIVIIILAVITIFGVNGVIEKAREAKILQEISNEKEIVSAATVQAKKEINSFNEETLGKALDNITGEDETYVFADSDNLAVQFKNSERYYLVNKDGVIEGPVSPIEDEYAGDITKNGKYDGSENKPYQINCIEDLVAFSIMTNGGNTELGLKNDKLTGKYVELMRTLDFQSMFSYNDYTSKKYGDLNKDTIEEDIRTELTKTDEGCIGFTPSGFRGIFEGNHHAIQNLYEYASEYGGLFSIWVGAELSIKNLEVSGEIISEGSAGGIAMDATLMENCISRVNIKAKSYVVGINTRGTIIHCKNYGNLEGQSYVTGISNQGIVIDCQNYGTITGTSFVAGISHKATVTNCQNYGTIMGDQYVGGINDAGMVNDSQNYGKVVGKKYIGGIAAREASINRCINYGNILGETEVGGIKGSHSYDTAVIRNSINYGNIEATNDYGSAGGIVGKVWYGALQMNCCNFGNIKGYYSGGISGELSYNDGKIANCYSVGALETTRVKGGILGYGGSTSHLENCYWPDELNTSICGVTGVQVVDSIAYPLSFMQSQDFVDILNEYVIAYNAEHELEEGFIALATWKLDEKTGYPILEFANE